MLRRAVGDLEDLLVAGDLRERLLEAVRVAGQLDRRRVGEVLALAADRQLDEPRDDRGEDREDDREEEHDHHQSPTALVPIAAPATTAPEREAQEEVGHQGDRADEHGDEQGEPDVEVADVGELVADDALELLAIELLEQARRDRDRCVLRVASGREGVRAPCRR